MKSKNSQDYKDLNCYTSLSDIKRIPLSIFDAHEILNSLQGSQDRICAIVGGELISTIVSNILCKKLNIEVDSLPFSSATRLNFIKGMISKEAYNEAKRIFAIRNAFAHSPVSLTFDAVAVARECKKLSARKQNDFKRLFQGVEILQDKIEYLRGGNLVSPDLLITDRRGTIGMDFNFIDDQQPKSLFINSVAVVAFGFLSIELEIS